MRFLHWFSLGLSWLLAVLPAAGCLAAGAPPVPGGIWRGALPVPGGTLEVVVSVVPLAGGKYFVALDVPARYIRRQVGDLTVRADSVVLQLPEAQSRYVARLDTVRRTLTGTWTRPGLRAPLQLTHGAMPSFDRGGVGQRADARAPMPYRTENLTFNNPQARLSLGGTLTLPPGAGPFPAVVLVSDLGPHNRDGRVGHYRPLGALADYLTRQGVAVLRYDDRGVGQSQGHDETATTADRCSDLQAALAYLRTRPELNAAQLGAIGMGEGANVALLAAARPLPPAFVVSLAGYGLPGQLTLLHQHVNNWRAEQLPEPEVKRRYEIQRRIYDMVRLNDPRRVQPAVTTLLHQQNPAQPLPVTRVQAAAYAQRGLHAFLGFDPILRLDQVNCPVLLLHGTADIDADYRLHLRALRGELRSVHWRAIRSRRLRDVNHLFQPPLAAWTMLDGELQPVFSPQAQQEIHRWLTKHLGPLEPGTPATEIWNVEVAAK